MKKLVLYLTLLVAFDAGAEQMRRLGDWDVHYVLIPTLFLNSDIASTYRITRGRDRALLNISVIGRDGMPVTAQLNGVSTNLLGQQQPLDFVEITEGSAIYYLAIIKHTDRETLRIKVSVTPPDQIPQLLEFQQQMFWETP